MLRRRLTKDLEPLAERQHPARLVEVALDALRQLSDTISSRDQHEDAEGGHSRQHRVAVGSPEMIVKLVGAVMHARPRL